VIADRYRRVAAAFTARVAAVTPSGWDAPTPCDGWVARDVVRHLVAWMPDYFLGGAGLPVPGHPSVATDPAGAWAAVNGAIQAALDDPSLAARPFAIAIGRPNLAGAVATYGIGDILIHTWDLARAAGLEDTLDPDEVHRLVTSIGPVLDHLRPEGNFGPPIEVAADADEQTRLLALTGRRAHP
jgi:uncharacterized protein (TIGR03086 family)